MSRQWREKPPRSPRKALQVRVKGWRRTRICSCIQWNNMVLQSCLLLQCEITLKLSKDLVSLPLNWRTKFIMVITILMPLDAKNLYRDVCIPKSSAPSAPVDTECHTKCHVTYRLSKCGFSNFSSNSNHPYDSYVEHQKGKSMHMNLL
jgi:hypothetical protein